MNLRRILVSLTAAALTCGSAVAAAQDGHGWEGRRGPMGGDPARMLQRMVSQLDLDETQEARVENILTAAKPEFEALRERGEAARAAIRALNPGDAGYSTSLSNLAQESGQAMSDFILLSGRLRADIHAVLTPEQAAELETLANERAERRAERRSGRRH